MRAPFWKISVKHKNTYICCMKRVRLNFFLFQKSVMYCWSSQWLMLQLTLGELLHMESWTFTENLIKVQLSASPWRRRTPESRRPHWDIYAASPGRPRCTARPSEDEFWAETGRRWGKRPDRYLNRHCHYGFLLLCITSPWGSPAGAAPRGGTEGKDLRCPKCPTSASDELCTKHCRWVNPESLRTTRTERGHLLALIHFFRSEWLDSDVMGKMFVFKKGTSASFIAQTLRREDAAQEKPL